MDDMSFFTQAAWVIVLTPLVVFAINGLYLGSKNRQAAAWFSWVMSGVTLIWATLVAVEYFSFAPNHQMQALIPMSYEWLSLQGDFHIGMGIYLDSISTMMLFVITFIHFLVQFYSISYMKDDLSSGRFFAQLSFFAFAMLGLVLSTNLFQMFIFWELVGTASYSLIGFWYHKPSAVAASKKAFIVTRFADAFFLLGIVILGFHTQTFDFSQLSQTEVIAKLQVPVSLGFFSINALGIVSVFIFAGGWGKSAMFPLHIWLPDAMEGPTPVSSIIHSATMVVAGVFLSARMFPLLSASPYAMEVIQVVGVFTALFAAVIAITQKDIKRILAFSTLSQLGYMMFAIGVSKSTTGEINTLGFSSAMFHVFNHAFFKCMLFLGAGSIIHVVHSNMLEKMGGLRRAMPLTYGSLLVACLAISGVPPFSGFYSKDEIILSAFQGGHTIIGSLGIIVGGLTAFYMFRFFFLIFHGKSRTILHNPHEDKMMSIPILVLTIPSLLAGIGFHHYFAENFFPANVTTAGEAFHLSWVPYFATFSGLLGIGLAWFFYARPEVDYQKILNVETRSIGYRTIYNKFYFDEIWTYFTKNIMFKVVASSLIWLDRNIIDRFFDLTSTVTHMSGQQVREFQSGKISHYLLATIFGLILIILLGDLPL